MPWTMTRQTMTRRAPSRSLRWRHRLAPLAAVAGLYLGVPAFTGAQQRSNWTAGASVGYFLIGPAQDNGVRLAIQAARLWRAAAVDLTASAGLGTDTYGSAELGLELSPLPGQLVTPVPGGGAGVMVRSHYSGGLAIPVHARAGVEIRMTARGRIRILARVARHVQFPEDIYWGPHALEVGYRRVL